MDRDEVVDEMNRRAATIQANIGELETRFDTLRIFQDAAAWDSDAEAVIRALEDFRGYIAEKRSFFQEALQEAQDTRKKLPVLKRTFSKDTEGDKLRKDLKMLDAGSASIDPAIEIIRSKADLTPTSKAEKREIAQYLKAEKGDLQLKKREVSADIRDAHSTHRQRATMSLGIRSGSVVGTMARLNRVSARLEREQALAPLEDQRRVLETQVNGIDRHLIWLSGFTGADPEPVRAEYCTYCGRRAVRGDPCSGCGSVQA